MTFKALLLDERDVLRGVVEVTEAELTERHIDLRPFGGECDSKPGEYRWDRVRKCLQPLPTTQRAREGRPTLEQAYAFDLLGRWKADSLSVPDTALAWLDEVVRSVDFGAFHQLPVVAEYRVARGLNKGA